MLKALGFNSLKVHPVHPVQAVGFKYQPAHPYTEEKNAAQAEAAMKQMEQLAAIEDVGYGYGAFASAAVAGAYHGGAAARGGPVQVSHQLDISFAPC